MEKQQTGSMLKKNFFRLVLLTIAGAAVYTLPYFRSYFYDAYLELYDLTNVQMGALGSAYGLLGLVSYLFGGVLADRFSARKLLAISMVLTGLGGFVHLVTKSYVVILIIYGMWGITSLLSFWPPLIKAIRMLANKEEQGRAFGLFEGGRGIVNAIVFPLGLAVFGYFAKVSSDAAGIYGVIIFYSVLTTLCGVLIYFTIADTEREENSKKFEMKNLLEVLKSPAVWLISFILFMTYTFNMSYYYLTPYATEVFGATAVFAAAVAILAQYCRPISSIASGFLGNKVGNSRMRMIAFGTMAVAMLVIAILPGGAGMTPFLTAASAVLYIAMFANYALVFAMLEEGGIPMHISGVAIGLVSTVGYLPEILAPLTAGALLDKFPGRTGYTFIFSILIVCAVLGMLGVYIWNKKYGNQETTSPEPVVEAAAE